MAKLDSKSYEGSALIDCLPIIESPLIGRPIGDPTWKRKREAYPCCTIGGVVIFHVTGGYRT